MLVTPVIQWNIIQKIHSFAEFISCHFICRTRVISQHANVKIACISEKQTVNPLHLSYRWIKKYKCGFYTLATTLLIYLQYCVYVLPHCQKGAAWRISCWWEYTPPRRKSVYSLWFVVWRQRRLAQVPEENLKYTVNHVECPFGVRKVGTSFPGRVIPK